MTKSVKHLTDQLSSLRVRFDRVAYRKAYDKVYFKKKIVCPRCGRCTVKHMLKRHMNTKKCKAAH